MMPLAFTAATTTRLRAPAAASQHKRVIPRSGPHIAWVGSQTRKGMAKNSQNHSNPHLQGKTAAPVVRVNILRAGTPPPEEGKPGCSDQERDQAITAPGAGAGRTLPRSRKNFSRSTPFT